MSRKAPAIGRASEVEGSITYSGQHHVLVDNRTINEIFRELDTDVMSNFNVSKWEKYEK